MIKLWAKIIVEEKIKQQLTYESLDNFAGEEFYLHIAEICHKLDIPSPVVLPMHIKHFTLYNSTTFKVRDFVESIDFDKLVIENIKQ